MYCVYTCILLILLLIFISVYIYTTYFVEKKSDSTNSNEYFYPNYPYLYKQTPFKLTSGQYNYKIDDRGGMYVWVNDPVMPLYIPCRKSEKYKEMCEYVTKGTNPFISMT